MVAEHAVFSSGSVSAWQYGHGETLDRRIPFRREPLSSQRPISYFMKLRTSCEI